MMKSMVCTCVGLSTPAMCGAGFTVEKKYSGRMFFMRCSAPGTASAGRMRRPPTAAETSCTLGAPTAKNSRSSLPDLKSSAARTTLTSGTLTTSLSEMPPALR